MNRQISCINEQGRAWTQNDEALLTDLEHPQQELVLAWIRKNLLRSKITYKSRSSYALKELVEQHLSDKGLYSYLSNNQFKDAMLMCGFSPVNPSEKIGILELVPNHLHFKSILDTGNIF